MGNLTGKEKFILFCLYLSVITISSLAGIGVSYLMGITQ